MAKATATYVYMEVVEEGENENCNLIKCGIDKYQAYMWGNSRLGDWRIAGSYILSRAITNEKLSMAGYATLMGSYIEWHPK